MAYEDCFGQVQRSKYDCLLFDLDDTLYPLSSGLAAACGNNIADFMVEKLGIDRSKTIDLGHLLYKNYGTTLAGLRAIGYDFDYDEFHSFVHGRLPYENLRPDPVLRSLLISLPYRKLIFTNADKVHAIKVLRILGIFVPLICTLNSLRFPHLLSARLFFFQGADYALENIHNIKEALPDRRDSIGSPVARGN